MLAAYHKRRRPPMDVYRRHRPAHGGAAHLRPDEPRVLGQWNDFTCIVVGTAPNLATAQAWETGPPSDGDPAV
ncbi:hypothetical protein [Streptomyces spectabilis]|nr:hypothetical protein [Streptomyces spectabilis]MBB5108848.1 hypothetical protein [Streptomyces spectabilis]MCI3899850.1 hypothetical protein [Streptomyces spectabilis]